MRVVHKDLVPPMIISGNQFTMISQHQVAAREYLEAYKQVADSPLVNLCAGMFHVMQPDQRDEHSSVVDVSLSSFLQGLPWLI